MKVLKIKNRALRFIAGAVVVAAAVAVGMVFTYHLGRFVLAVSPSYECGRSANWGAWGCTTEDIIMMGLMADLSIFVVGMCLWGLGYLAYRVGERFFDP